VEPATFTFVPAGQAPAAGTWWMVFLDDSDQADALAYHDLTDEGLPISKAFVKSVLADKASVSVAATHELCEMAVDPWLNGAYQDPQGGLDRTIAIGRVRAATKPVRVRSYVSGDHGGGGGEDCARQVCGSVEGASSAWHRE
jgi:hypothetical protein